MIKADLHVHTCVSDGRNSVKAMAKRAKKLGLDAIAVTDHNKMRKLPECEIMLIPGIEINTDVGHMLGLFVDGECDVAADSSAPMKAADAIDFIHAHGGLAGIAHPFEFKTAKESDFDGLELDFIETANARACMKIKNANTRAAAYAKHRGVTQTGGSDAHGACELCSCYTELYGDDPRAALENGKTRAVFVHTCRWINKGRSRVVSSFRSGSIKKSAKSLIFFCYTIFKEVQTCLLRQN